MRTSRVSVAVRLCGDVLALAFAIALVRPGWAHGILWILGGVASFAVMGLYAKRLRMTALDDLAVFVGSAVGVAAMSLSRPGGVRVAVAEAVLGGLLVVWTRMGTYALLRSSRSRGLLHT